MRARSCALATAALVMAIQSAAAGPDPSKADALFREGRALIRKGDFAGACAKLAESQRLDPAAGTLVNLAECAEKQGKLADALASLRDALQLLKAGDDRIPLVNRQIAALEERVPRLVLKVGPNTPAGTKIIIDGVEYDAETIKGPVEVNPGPHAVVVAVPGKKQERQGVEAKEGDAHEVVVGDGSLRSDSSPGRSNSNGATQRTLGYVIGGAGALGILMGAVSYVQFRNKESEREGICAGKEQSCSQSEINRDLSLKDESNAAGSRAAIGLVAGGLALAGGVALVLSAPRDGESVSIQAGPASDVAGLSLRVRGTW